MEDNRAEELFLEADELSDDNKYVEARDVLIELLQDFPDYGRAYSLLGWMYQNKFSNTMKAKVYYELAMKYAPDFSGGFNNYAYLLVETNEYDEMIRFGLKNMDNKTVDKATLMNKMGQAYELKGNLLKALEHYNLAVRDSLSMEALQSLYAAKSRIKKKMNLIQKLKTLFK